MIRFTSEPFFYHSWYLCTKKDLPGIELLCGSLTKSIISLNFCLTYIPHWYMLGLHQTDAYFFSRSALASDKEQTMEQKLLKDLKVGEFFTLKPIEEPTENVVWVRSDYDRAEKKYEVYKRSDVNHFSLKNGNTKVYVGFTF